MLNFGILLGVWKARSKSIKYFHRRLVKTRETEDLLGGLMLCKEVSVLVRIEI
jgi:hypothetical protein